MHRFPMHRALLAVTLLNGSLFADSQQEPAKETHTAEYCAPAAVHVSNGWGDNALFFEAGYTYWHASEEGLDLGRSGDFLAADDPFFNSENTLLSQPFNYQSGFKLATGWVKNDWMLVGEYTWVRNKTSQHALAPTVNPNLGTGVWVVAPWFLQLADDGGSLSGIRLFSEWKLSMDIGDLSLSRPYYLGRRLTMTPFGGLRTAWIRQRFDIALTETPGILVAGLPSQPIHSLNRSNSWSIGPRFGTQAHVLLGSGFKLEGALGFSLLFTEYTKILHLEDPAVVDAFPGSIASSIRNKIALRPVLETGLGLGWGRYFCSNRFHLQLSLDYDFMLWWNQNMIRKTMNSLWNASPVNGDLYLHGLTVRGGIQF